MSIFLVVFMYATWSSVFSFAKIALEHSPPLFLTASRMLLAAVLLLGYLAIRKRSTFKFTGKQILLLCLLALFSIYLTNACEFWSLQHLTAAKACFIYSLSPFFAALFSYLHFGEKMNGRKWLGVAVGIVGFIPVLAIQKGAGELLTSFSFLSWPELAMMGASLSTAYGWILLRMIVNPSPQNRAASKPSAISPLMANGASMLLGGLLALGHSYLVEIWNPIPVTSSSFAPFAQGVLTMTFISNILCYNLYGFLLKRFTATFLSFMGLLSPIFASLNSWFFLGEQPSPVIFFSTAVVSLGLWMIYSAELRQGYIRKAESAPAYTARG
jgi:drug/metabolite transporter (DMT)-like permease